LAEVYRKSTKYCTEQTDAERDFSGLTDLRESAERAE